MRRRSRVRHAPRSRRTRDWHAPHAPDPRPAVAQHELRSILNALPALVGYWDDELRNHMANDAYVEFFGLTPRQMRGMHIRDVLGPELYAKDEPYIRGALAGEPQLFDRAIRTPSGALRHTQASYIPDVDGGKVRGFFALVTDITPRREAEQALAVAEKRFRALFESAPIGKYLAHADGRLVDVNPAGARLLGGTREALLGLRPAVDLTHPDDLATSDEHLARLVAGEIDAYRLEQRYVRLDGETFWAQVDVTALRGDAGDDLVVLAQVQDISERRRHEAQLTHLAEHDALTGLLNRRGFMAHVELQAVTVARYGAASALLVVDLDGFKAVNDTLGHQAGDELLAEVGRLLRERVRRTDVVGRLGGDEFAVLLPRDDLEAGLALGQALVEVLRARSTAMDRPVAASIGVAAFAAGQSAEDVLTAADLAMYRAKNAGGDRVAHAGDPAPHGS